MSQEEDIKQLLVNHQRRLQKLKERKATLGINTPPEVLTEIEDLEAEIQKLKADEATTSQTLKKEVLTEISLACHSWKVTYMSLSPEPFKEPGDKQYIDIWEHMLEFPHKYSIKQWERFKPLFGNAINYVLEELFKISSLYPEMIPLELKTLILQSKRQLETQQRAYSVMPQIMANVAGFEGDDNKDAFFGQTFIAVINVLSELARTTDRLQED